MTITNNKQNVRYLFYQVDGIPKSVKFGPLETISVSDFTSTSQIIYNQLDYKLNSYNQRFGTVFPLDFTVGLTDYHLLDTWYASLAVKPSAGLWTDLQTLANGMYADGDWQEADFISLTAALETDEQRLKPLYTTSNSAMTTIGNITLTVSGITETVPDDFDSGVNANWIPNTHKVKYALNNAFYGAYFEVDTTDNFFFGGTIVGANGTYMLTFNNSSVDANATMALNYDISSNINKGTFANTQKQIFSSIKRLNATQVNVAINNVSGTTSTNIGPIPTVTLYALGRNDGPGGISSSYGAKLRFTILGSNAIVHNRVASRLNTFFSSRGLSVSRY